MNIVVSGVDLLREARRVMVIGCSGAGKSTLARELAAALDLPHIVMDRDFFWLPGWKLRDRAEIRNMMGKSAAEERWIMDGNSPGTLDLRLPRAEIVIWLRVTRLLCLARVILRWVRYAGRQRPEMAEGCPEKIDIDFLRYIWNFERTESPEIVDEIEKHRPDVPVLFLRHPREVDALVASLRSKV